MTLKKIQLVRAVRKSLATLGYTSITESQSLSSGLFCKYLGDDFFLTIGLEIHRFYDCRYTCSYYYSKTTDWGQLECDIPKKCFQRIGVLFTEKERERYFGKNSAAIDKWWESIDDVTVADFIETIKKTEPRIIGDISLRNEIEKSKTISQAVSISKRICAVVREHSVPTIQYDYLPPKEVDNIPMEWYKAAEFVRREANALISRNYVLYNAAEAYRRHMLAGE